MRCVVSMVKLWLRLVGCSENVVAPESLFSTKSHTCLVLANPSANRPTNPNFRLSDPQRLTARRQIFPGIGSLSGKLQIQTVQFAGIRALGYE